MAKRSRRFARYAFFCFSPITIVNGNTQNIVFIFQMIKSLHILQKARVFFLLRDDSKYNNNTNNIKCNFPGALNALDSFRCLKRVQA